VIDAELLKTILLYIPLSLIGAWRWTFWLVRRITAEFYNPQVQPWPADEVKPTTSIVTPVYNEDPIVFEEAMQSWIANGVDEIVAVIDKSNTRHIVDFQRRYVDNPTGETVCRVVVTPKPGKRAALCDGIEAATGDLIVLVDSDTIWSSDVLEKTLPYFQNERIGGATVAQRIQNPYNVANVMFDILLYSRYKEEVPFLLATGRAFNTLSGRTAFYRREAIFNDTYDNMHALRHEFFLGTRGISGDDKRLTHLIVEQGWHTAFVKGPVVLTPGLNSVKKFLKQRLRWTRNSWRADLRAVGRGWVFSHPALAIFMIDRFIQPVFMLIGPVVMTFALINHEWLFAGILLAWWFISRIIRVFGYFKQYPKRLIYLPAYILYGYANAVIKIYALATLIEHSWATRWNKARAKRKSIFRKAYTVVSGYAAIVVFMVLIVQIVLSLRTQAGADITVPAPVDATAFNQQVQNVTQLQKQPPAPQGYIDPTVVKEYTVQSGDTLSGLSIQFNMTVQDIKRFNTLRTNALIPGQVIFYYMATQG